MYGSTSAFPHVTKLDSRPLGKKSALLRELSDEGDLECFNSPSPDRVPWLEEFGKYYDAKDTVPEGMSIVEWWGVCGTVV
jgi:hypothetical protein